MLKPHQDAPRAILPLCLGQQGGGGRSLTDCMRAAEDKRPCRGGQNKTEENSEERASQSLVVTSQPPQPATSSSPARRHGKGPRRGTETWTARERAGGEGPVGTGTHTCSHVHTRHACMMQ